MSEQPEDMKIAKALEKAIEINERIDGARYYMDGLIHYVWGVNSKGRSVVLGCFSGRRLDLLKEIRGDLVFTRSGKVYEVNWIEKPVDMVLD